MDEPALTAWWVVPIFMGLLLGGSFVTAQIPCVVSSCEVPPTPDPDVPLPETPLEALTALLVAVFTIIVVLFFIGLTIQVGLLVSRRLRRFARRLERLKDDDDPPGL